MTVGDTGSSSGGTSDPVAMEVRKNEAAGRYELWVDGALSSYADYLDDGHVVTFPHTVTLPHFRNQGYAARVVRFALDDARAAGRRVRPLCWFVAQFVHDNPGYADLLETR